MGTAALTCRRLPNSVRLSGTMRHACKHRTVRDCCCSCAQSSSSSTRAHLPPYLLVYKSHKNQRKLNRSTALSKLTWFFHSRLNACVDHRANVALYIDPIRDGQHPSIFHRCGWTVSDGTILQRFVFECVRPQSWCDVLLRWPRTVIFQSGLEHRLETVIARQFKHRQPHSFDVVEIDLSEMSHHFALSTEFVHQLFNARLAPMLWHKVVRNRMQRNLMAGRPQSVHFWIIGPFVRHIECGCDGTSIWIATTADLLLDVFVVQSGDGIIECQHHQLRRIIHSDCFVQFGGSTSAIGQLTPFRITGFGQFQSVGSQCVRFC